MTKRNDFTSFEEFHLSGTAGNYEEVTVICENGWIKTDLLTECKSYKTALRRFFKALADIPAIVEWLPGMLEAAENGCFKMNDNTMADGTRNPCTCYAYEIEELDNGLWYIFLNVRGEEPATTPTEPQKAIEDTEAHTPAENATQGDTAPERMKGERTMLALYAVTLFVLILYAIVERIFG